MKCPICKRVIVYEDNPYRPFCSERCKLIDLDNWLSERYRISTPAEKREQNGLSEHPGRNAKRGRD
jgi:endogenous inhibitor of DNA gyrase (YacG/DUF329 family)